MTVAELFNSLIKQNIDGRIIYTGEGNPEGRYAILLNGIHWNVYYSERGQEFESRVFLGEFDAVEYLIYLLVKDKTVNYKRC